MQVARRLAHNVKVSILQFYTTFNIYIANCFIIFKTLKCVNERYIRICIHGYLFLSDKSLIMSLPHNVCMYLTIAAD